MWSRSETARYLTILLAALPGFALGYRHPSPLWLLLVVVGSLPILIYHVVVLSRRSREGPPHRHYRLVMAVCIAALPVAVAVGRGVESFDFRHRRMAIYEQVVARIERGEIPVGTDGARIEVPADKRGGALAISAARTKEAGLVVQFLWGTAGYAGGSAYLYCRGDACEKLRGWRHYSRINDRWLWATDH